ncbi:MAG: hypothetical protein IJ697_02260 [Synergistaceae bacterium]|nr:hypothetical protein [Synergistaceae bacterium]
MTCSGSRLRISLSLSICSWVGYESVKIAPLANASLNAGAFSSVRARSVRFVTSETLPLSSDSGWVSLLTFSSRYCVVSPCC